MSNSNIPRVSVLARWAYSELIGTNTSPYYEAVARNFQLLHGWDEIERKRADQVPFAELAESERYTLALACALVRPVLMSYLTGVDAFVERKLAKSQVDNLLVPPQFDFDLLQGKPMRLAAFLSTAHGDASDARNVWHYSEAADPIVVGNLYDQLMLLDGIHRLAGFLRRAPADAVIRAYLPANFASA